MSFLIKADYSKIIQSENLSQVSGSSDSNMAKAELTAIAQMNGYLKQKYNMDSVFVDTLKWDSTVAFAAGNQVYLNPPAFDASLSYTIGKYVTQAGNVYKAPGTIAAGAFNAAQWTLIGEQYSLYYAKYPAQLFNYQSTYAIGDTVYYNGKVYTCALASIFPNHDALLQIGYTTNNPIAPNYFPGDGSTASIQQWGTGTAYSIATGVDILNAAYWTPGDIRNQMLVTKLVDIALYYLHQRIAPRNIPVTRVSAYKGDQEDISNTKEGTVFPEYSALGWLQCCMKGDLTVDLPLIQPRVGNRIRFGSQQKQTNTY